MQLKASTDYGMRAILYLAAQGTTCSSKDIAEDMSIPRDYLIQLAQLLRNAGIIEALSGAPFDVKWISFDDIRSNPEILDDIDVILNVGDADTAYTGGENWTDEKIILL